MSCRLQLCRAHRPVRQARAQTSPFERWRSSSERVRSPACSHASHSIQLPARASSTSLHTALTPTHAATASTTRPLASSSPTPTSPGSSPRSAARQARQAVPPCSYSSSATCTSRTAPTICRPSSRSSSCVPAPSSPLSARPEDPGAAQGGLGVARGHRSRPGVAAMAGRRCGRCARLPLHGDERPRSAQSRRLARSSGRRWGFP